MTEEAYDLIVVGGGLSGLGIALEASRWGFSVALIEKNKICCATSQNSLRIIHGGFRYLQKLDFSRTRESINACQELLSIYPQYIKKMPCLLPLKPFGMKSRLPVSIANLIYSYLMKSEIGVGAENHILSSRKVSEEVKLLEGLVKSGALVWYDATIENFTGFIGHLISQARNQGAEIYEEYEALEIGRTGRLFNVQCRNTNQSFNLISRSVINTTGPWIDRMNTRLGVRNTKNSFRWSKAYNLVLNKKLEDKYAVGLDCKMSTGQYRVLFLTPRENCTVIGTEYKFYDGDPSQVSVSKNEQEEMISLVNSALGKNIITKDDVSGIEVGVLPCELDAELPDSLIGSEKIWASNGYIEVLSTKLTTFMPQARKALFMASQVIKN